MRKVTKSLVTLGLCTTMLSGMMAGVPTVSLLKAGNVENVYAADNEQVELGDLVLRFLAIGEYEPNRYTKKDGGKWAPEEIEKGLLIKADMVLGEGNVEGMMAPMKYSLQDITGHVDADVNTGNIVITYNGLTLTMKAGSTTAELDNGKEKTTLTMRSEIAPYFKKVDEEKNVDGSDYYACYLPVKFTAEALGGNVIWNDAMHRIEMAFAFYASDAAASPVVNSKSDYTTKKMESNSNTYSKMKGRIDVTKLDEAAVKANVADMIKAGLNVVNPVYQNEDGGWAKTNTEYDLLEDSFARLYTKGYSTVDNGATHGHMKFLSRIIRLSKENPELFAGYETQLSAIEKGFWKAAKYMCDSQNNNGGWPQYYPYGIGYFRNITFNDNAMPDLMESIYALSNDKGLTDNELCEDYAWARDEIKAQTNPYVLELGIKHDTLKEVWDNGLDFVIRAQVVIDGIKTGWAQQYDPDEKNPVPAGGRAFELPSVSPDESLTMVKVLANIVNPSKEVKDAITSYVNWINSVGITGYGVYNIADRTRELGTDRLILKDGSTTKQFGRFYGLDTTGEYYGFTKAQMANKMTDSKFYEIFAGRDSVAQLSMNYGMGERRIGYSYVKTKADVNATAVYNTWKKALGE